MFSFKNLLVLSVISTVAFASPTSFEGRGLQARQDWLSGTQSGDATFYATGLGACGITNSDSDHIVAVSSDIFENFPGFDGQNPNNNPICGKKINVHYQGKTVQVTVEDECPGCGTDDLDLSPSAFQVLASEDLGRIPITWEWA